MISALFEKGCAKAREVIGEDALKQLIESNKSCTPNLSRYVIEYIWGDLFSSESALDLRSREIATIAALSALGDCSPQLKVHINGALNVGVSAQEIAEVITHIAGLAGVPRALNAAACAREVFSQRGI
jgi:4-carboxymuconolactone decarboxylase